MIMHAVDIVFAAKVSSWNEVRRKVSNAVLPAMKKAAATAEVILKLPHESDPVLSCRLVTTDEGKPYQDNEGRFHLQVPVFFFSDDELWDQATSWLHTAIAAIEDTDVALISLSNSSHMHIGII